MTNEQAETVIELLRLCVKADQEALELNRSASDLVDRLKPWHDHLLATITPKPPKVPTYGLIAAATRSRDGMLSVDDAAELIDNAIANHTKKD